MKFLILITLFVLFGLSGNPLEARLKYQENSPYTCDSCHNLRGREFNDVGLYFFLNGLKMTGWKPVNSEDKEIQATADIRLSMKIAKLAEQKNKNEIALKYMNFVLVHTIRWKGDPLPEQKQAEEMNLDYEKKANKLLGKAEADILKTGKVKENAIRLYAQLSNEYTDLKFVRQKLQSFRASAKKDPDPEVFKKYTDFLLELKNSKTINEIEELLDLKCYLSAKKRILQMLKSEKGNDALTKKLLVIQDKLKEGDIPKLLEEEEMTESAYDDFIKIDKMIKEGIKSNADKRQVILALRDMMIKYRNTVHETRATEIYAKVIEDGVDPTKTEEEEEK
ncbi:MAG: hypothetical protein AABZ60_17330 [Planctomycetota bacterium]